MSINYRDFIVPFLLVLIFTVTFNYFIGNKLRKESQQTGEVRSGERMTVPSTPIQFKPLNKEIDFIDTKSSRIPEHVTINTSRAKYIFNNDGAICPAFLSMAAAASCNSVNGCPFQAAISNSNDRASAIQAIFV